MRVLLSFTGFHDPYSKSLIGEEDQPGPVLSVLGGIHYDRVVLFSTPRTAGHSELTEAAIHTGNANLQVELIHLNLDDPTDYRAILSALRHHGREIRERFPGAEIHIATASGTPQMHACWLLLTASQELPARLLHIRPPQFITDGRPAISTIEVTGADFPVIRAASPVLSDEYSDDSAPPGDLNAALREVGLIAHHPLTIDCVQQAAAVAPYSLPALILGETGSGKELIARLIHRLSQRPVTKFVAVNCGAIPPDLVESTLFGHKKGSFTGAVSDLTVSVRATAD
jgi:sigma54-dependent transcription regulator